jgi:transposase InsO family protein
VADWSSCLVWDRATDGPHEQSRASILAAVRVLGMTHVRTSPFYPQSNGKIERWHKSLKGECIQPGTPRRKRSRVALASAEASLRPEVRLFYDDGATGDWTFAKAPDRDLLEDGRQACGNDDVDLVKPDPSR